MQHNHTPNKTGLPWVTAALLLAAMFLVLPQTSAQGPLILEEEFDYGDTAGKLVDVSGGNWIAHSSGAPYVQYVPAGLSLDGYGASGAGGAATFGAAMEDVSRELSPPAAGDLYVAALVRISQGSPSGNYFLHLRDTKPASAARVFARLSGGCLQFGFGNSNDVTYSPTAFALDTTYLLVVKYNVGTADAALYVLDAYTPTEPAAPLLTDTGDPITVEALAIRQGSEGPTGTIDGIRAAGTWQDAVGRGLLVHKSAPSLVIPGQLFTYTITAGNSTGQALNDLVITDTVPANATFVSASDGGALHGGVVEWRVAGPVAPGTLVVLNLRVTATDTNNVQIVNDDYGADAANWGTPVTGGPVATDVFQEVPTDIQVIKSGPTAAVAGEVLIYTLVVSNTSGLDAAGVVLTDTLPAGLAYESDDIGAPANPSAGIYAWTLGDLAAGTSRTYHLNVRVEAAVPAATLLENQAEVSTTTNESDLADNASRWTTTVYELLTIAEARQRVNEAVLVEGTVTAEPGIFVDSGVNGKLYMQDDTAGIVVSRQSGLEPVARGNKLRVAGRVEEFRGETRIVPPSAGDVADLGPAAPVVPADSPTGAAGESLEGELVHVFGRIVARPGDDQLRVDDGTGIVDVLRYSNLGVQDDPHYIDTTSYQVGDHIDATGVARGYGYDDGIRREILPRGPQDLRERYVVTLVYHDVEDVVRPGEAVALVGNFGGPAPDPNPLTPDAAHSVFTTTVTLDTPGVYGYAYLLLSGSDLHAWLNSDWREIDVQGSPTVDDYRAVRVDQAQLLGPPAISVNMGEPTGVISGGLRIPDLTGPEGEGRGVWAEIGYGTGADLDAWTWTDMSYVASEGSGACEDLYDATLLPLASGVYSYAVRFDGNRGPGNPNAGWTYGDLDGTEAGSFELSRTGVLTVTGPSLSIAKDVQPAAGVAPGGIVTYTVTLTNEGEGPAVGIALIDVLPEEVTFDAWIEQGGATENEGTVQWRGDLAAGAAVTIAFTAKVGTGDALYGRTVTNSASFTSTNGGSGAAEAAFVLRGRLRIYLPLVTLDRAS